MAQIQIYLILFLGSPFILCLKGNYVSAPKNSSNLRGVLNEMFKLKCTYIGTDDDGQFIGWYQDGQSINPSDSNHYSIETTAKYSTLTIKLNETDQNIKEWSIKTNKSDEEYPNQCRFGSITIKPSPKRIDTDRVNETLDNEHQTVKRQPDETIILKCILVPELFSPARSGRTKWEFSKDKKTYGKLPNGVNKSAENDIVIKKIHKNHRGYYRCTRNQVSVHIYLHVKDRFAALWPFIGIVSTVMVLVIAILLLEKHQKAKKKAAAAATEDGNLDQANNPLVPTGNKSVDDMNKKSTVNA